MVMKFIVNNRTDFVSNKLQIHASVHLLTIKITHEHAKISAANIKDLIETQNWHEL